jgi:hypothetical protein
MKSSTLAEIEKKIAALSVEEKRLLMGELAYQVRSAGASADFKERLQAMAADPEIQREIQAINEEFSGTEMDGLENL